MARKTVSSRAFRWLGERSSGLQVIHDSVAANTPSGERILLHLPSGIYVKLDSTASEIFDLLVDYQNVPQAAVKLSSKFLIPLDRATADITNMLETLNALRPSRSSSRSNIEAEWCSYHSATVVESSLETSGSSGTGHRRSGCRGGRYESDGYPAFIYIDGGPDGDSNGRTPR